MSKVNSAYISGKTAHIRGIMSVAHGAVADGITGTDLFIHALMDDVNHF